MTSYYPMERIRDVIIAKQYTVKTDREQPVPLPYWNRYPSCPMLKRCRKMQCTGAVSIYVNTEKTRWIYLEIYFFREKERAFIRTDDLQLLILHELGIIDVLSLQKDIETF
jgi:hypothetical protein